MSEIAFTAEQREIIKREVNRHAIAAYAKGLADGRTQAGPEALAKWLKTAWSSWTMRGAGAAAAYGLLADAWPVAAELLAGFITPQALATIGAIVFALRSRSIGK